MLSPKSEKLARKWLGQGYDAKTRKELKALFAAENWKELEDRFYTQLEFGTGGLRGIMAAGANRMNQYTVAQATQGLANYIRKMIKKSADRRVAIAYDSRHRSREFSETVSSVLAANGIGVFLFRRLRPTPELSFAVCHLRCCAGLVITASHNPKEYSGYKCYWRDGAQVVPPHDKGIIAEVRKVDRLAKVKRMPFKEARDKGLVSMIGAEIDSAFLAAVHEHSLFPQLIRQYGPEVKIVYTPLHGTGGEVIPRALKQWGLKNVIEVASQSKPDGDFPTAASPNPEEAVALAEALKVARQHDADLVLATDPDADRLGIAVRERKGRYRLLSGNQLGGMLAWYLCEGLHETAQMPENPLLVTTIVTSDIGHHICAKYDVKFDTTLTGFKWICEKVRLNEERQAAGKSHDNFIYGYEESYGFTIGQHARDKDAVVSCCAVAEMACWARAQGIGLLGLLDRMHQEFGVFAEDLQSKRYPGKVGMERIRSLMRGLRAKPPKSIGGIRVTGIVDYQKNTVLDCKSGAVTKGPGLPRSNVLEFQLAGGNKILARPSGTEPKIKFYFNFVDRTGLPIASKKILKEKRVALQSKLETCRDAFLKRLT